MTTRTSAPRPAALQALLTLGLVLGSVAGARAQSPFEEPRAAESPAGKPADTHPSTAAPPVSNPLLLYQPPDTTAILNVETRPAGLEVLVDGVSVGRSPVGPLHLVAKTVHVRVVPVDPRSFSLAQTASDVTLRSGSQTTAYFDLRPSVIVRSDPEPVTLALVVRASAPDSLLGETPFSIPPALLENGSLRFQRGGYVDTTISGASFLADSGPPRVALRLDPRSKAHSAGTSHKSAAFYRKPWLHWTLIGTGLALSGAAVAFHRQADDYYDKYQASTDVEAIPGLYDQTVHYDHLAAVSFGAGQVALIGGLVLILTSQAP